MQEAANRNKLEWWATSRLIIHFGDAAPHGKEFHPWENYDDRYPQGKGVNPLESIKVLRDRGVDYYIAKIPQKGKLETETMIKKFREVYTSVPNAGQFHEIEGYQDASSFVNITVSSVSKTVRRQQVLAQSVDKKERN